MSGIFERFLKEFQYKRTVIFGLNGSGKTNLTKFLLDKEKNHMVYDPLKEYTKYNTYSPGIIDGSPESREEFSEFIKHLIIPVNNLQWVVFDESNVCCPSKPTPLPGGMLMLNDWCRHFGKDGSHTTQKGKGFACIARRPSQLHQDLTELSHYVISFVLKGIRDETFFANMGIPTDVVTSLKPFHFVIIDQNRNYDICKPVPVMG